MRIQPPPLDQQLIVNGKISKPWQQFFIDSQNVTNDAAPSDGPFITRTANAALTAAFNLGTLATGYLKQTTVLGVATPTTVTGIPASDLTGTTLPASIINSSLTSVSTLVGGSTGVGFTIALSASTVTGTLADARLSANVPLLNAANTFTGGQQTISALSDFTGLLLIATGVARPRIEFSNVTTGTLGTLYYDNAAGFTIRRTLGGNADLLTLTSAGVLTLPSYTATTFVAGDFFLVVNAAGVVHRSAIGPLS